jgi:hypothetical protein
MRSLPGLYLLVGSVVVVAVVGPIRKLPGTGSFAAIAVGCTAFTAGTGFVSSPRRASAAAIRFSQTSTAPVTAAGTSASFILARSTARSSSSVLFAQEEEEFSNDAESSEPGGEEEEEESDPRVFQKRLRQRQLDAVIRTKAAGQGRRRGQQMVPKIGTILNPPPRQVAQKRRQGLAASRAMDLPEQPIVQTIAGGTSLIFAMARQMAAASAFNYEQQQQQRSASLETAAAIDQPPEQAEFRSGAVSAAAGSAESSTVGKGLDAGLGGVTGGVVPRWHPTAGISDRNPNFRTQPPLMNSQGYAATIWRNARKRNRPVYWRYALRTYDRMQSERNERASSSSGSLVTITNVHYEGALVAAAKLGWSAAALDIYETVCALEAKHLARGRSLSTAMVRVTENMLLSLVRVCVRDAKQHRTRDPLDTAVRLLQTRQEEGRIPITASYWNPVAAAYQSLGFRTDSKAIVQENLKDRIGDPEAESSFETGFNVYDVQAKDKGSYALQVSNAVNGQDWGEAIDALRDMTAQGGMFPENRHLNLWTEISERQTRQRYARSWKKKRDAALAERSIAAALRSS